MCKESASKANPSPIDVECSLINQSESDIIRTQVCQTGTRITVKWTKEQVGDSGWKPGWNTADVQGYDDINDEISLIYPGEPDFVYKMDVEPSHVQSVEDLSTLFEPLTQFINILLMVQTK